MLDRENNREEIIGGQSLVARPISDQGEQGATTAQGVQGATAA